jgi:hypothetical protein
VRKKRKNQAILKAVFRDFRRKNGVIRHPAGMTPRLQKKPGDSRQSPLHVVKVHKNPRSITSGENPAFIVFVCLLAEIQLMMTLGSA